MEGYLRRLVWLWRDEPETFAKVAAAVTVVGSLSAAYCVGKWLFDAPKPKQRKGELTERTKARILSKTTAKTGMILPSFALRAALTRATRLATMSGSLKPLGTSNTYPRAEGDLPFLITVISPEAFKQKQGGGAGAFSPRALVRSVGESLGLPYLWARAKITLEEPSSRFVEKLRAVSLLGLAPHAALTRVVTKTVRAIGNTILGSKHPSNDAFAPPLPIETFVCNLSATHALVLNKFYIFEGHAVIVPTKEFEPQTEALTVGDMHALWRW
jgi:Ap4A phosphorylase N-terminal domain